MRKAFEILAILVNLAIGLACLGLAVMGWTVGGSVSMPLLPVDPEGTNAALAIAGIFRSSCLVRSVQEFPLGGSSDDAVSIALLAVLKLAVFRANYRFDGIESFVDHAWLVGGAAILLLASFARYRSAVSAIQLQYDRRARLRSLR